MIGSGRSPSEVKKENDPPMKKIMMLMLGLVFTLGTVAPSFAQNQNPDDKKEEKKKKKEEEDRRRKEAIGLFVTAPPLSRLWRTHSSVPRRDSSRRVGRTEPGAANDLRMHPCGAG
jgi:hypothetical protein